MTSQQNETEKQKESRPWPQIMKFVWQYSKCQVSRRTVDNAEHFSVSVSVWRLTTKCKTLNVLINFFLKFFYSLTFLQEFSFCYRHKTFIYFFLIKLNKRILYSSPLPSYTTHLTHWSQMHTKLLPGATTSLDFHTFLLGPRTSSALPPVRAVI